MRQKGKLSLAIDYRLSQECPGACGASGHDPQVEGDCLPYQKNHAFL